jgi:hypothetical protein
MHSRTVTTLAVALTFVPSLTFAAPQSSTSNIRPTRVIIYPLLVEATVFGASADTSGDGGGGGGDGGGAAGETDLSFNAAWMAGALVQFPHWFVEGNVTWAAVSASRVTPVTRIDTNVWLADVRGGPRLKAGFSATAGVRRIAVDLDASLTTVASPKTVPVATKVGLWDPLVGVDWRREFGSLSVNANVQAGGFGVGTDLDVTSDVHADWRFVPHVTLRFGYQTLYYRWTADATVDGAPRTIKGRQTMHGPSVGLGIEF